MLDATYLKSKHEAALPYQDYVATGSPDQQAAWQKNYDLAQLTNTQRGLIAAFTRRINIIGLTGIWCGDCAQQCPAIQRIAEAHPAAIDLRWLGRDEHGDLQTQVRINGGDRVPVLIFCAEDYELVGWYGDRTLSRYRSIAAKQVGASCSLPGAPVDNSLLVATTQDWLNEIERVHRLLRLSGRLRQKHGD